MECHSNTVAWRLHFGRSTLATTTLESERMRNQRTMICLGSVRKSCYRRRGSIVVLTAFLMTALLAAVAFSVDVSYMQLVRVELRASTELAARAGAENILRTSSASRSQGSASRHQLHRGIEWSPVLAMLRCSQPQAELESRRQHDRADRPMVRDRSHFAIRVIQELLEFPKWDD